MDRLQYIVKTRRRKTTGHILRLHRELTAICTGCRLGRRQKKEGEAEEDMAKHLQRRPGRDGCQLACSPQDRQ